MHDLLRRGGIDKIPAVKPAAEVQQECRPDPHGLLKKRWQEKAAAVLKKVRKHTVAALSKMLILCGAYKRQTEAMERAREARRRELEKSFAEQTASAAKPAPEPYPKAVKPPPIPAEEWRELLEFEKQFYADLPKQTERVENEQQQRTEKWKQRIRNTGHGMGFD